MILFVLVISMVKTNAQTVYEQFLQRESKDRMLLKLHPDATMEDVDAVLRKVADDRNFSTSSQGVAGYFVLDRKPGSNISKEDALRAYMSEPYIAYASFVFMDDEETFTGYANDIFVKAKPGVSRDEIIALAKRYGMTGILDYRPQRNIYQLYFDKEGNTFERSDKLFQSGAFVFTEPNFYTTAIRPNAVIGRATNSMGDCPVVNNTVDAEMTSFNQWGLFTGTYAQCSSAMCMVPMNTGGDPSKFLPFLSDINVCHAWNFNNGSAQGKNVGVQGSGIYVAVIDDGVDTRHPDLTMRKQSNGNVYGYDPVNAPGPVISNLIYSLTTDPGCPDEGYHASCTTGAVYHGTGVAGIINARRNNTFPGSGTSGRGLAGVAPLSEIMPVHAWWRVNVCDAKAGATSGQILANGIYWATDNNADIINCSWGWNAYNSTKVAPRIIQDAIEDAVTNGRGGKGCVVVAGAGNQNWVELGWPACNPNVIAVGASTMCGERKTAGPFPNHPSTPNLTFPDVNGPSCDGWVNWGSNYGSGPSTPYKDHNGNNLDCSNSLSVVAPGVDITTTIVNRPYTTPYGGGYDYLYGGTSAAGPFVSGVAALMLSVNPCLEWQEVKQIIEASAYNVNPSQYTYSSFTGWSNEMGYGLLNAGNAVTLAYDLYKQSTTETGTKAYKSANHLFAGWRVTDIEKVPTSAKYIVSGGARIDFFAPNNNAVHLLPGFETMSGANFNAEITTGVCDNSQYHLKPETSDNEVRDIEYFAQRRSNAVQQITVYPNPVKDVLNISLSLSVDDKVSFTILNTLGQKMGQPISIDLKAGKHKQTISATELIPGIYTIIVHTTKGTDQYKFTKE